MENKTKEPMKTIINSNGSKWAGQSPDGLEVLEKRLKENKLDLHSFAKCGFVSYHDENVTLFGNFLDISHVFNIEGYRPNLRRLEDLIQNNIDNQLV